MNDKFNFDDMTDEQCEEYKGCLTDADFYPAPDNRSLKSNVEDIIDGDNFADYCEYIFGILDEEEYYD